MQIRIGFVNNARELSLTIDGTQEEVEAKINEALENQKLLTLTDNKGTIHTLRTSEVIYVLIGAEKKETVGFAGIFKES
ncbi:DUF3107 domain-containing protein [Corynebacterium caspium]|uniref:DUF3107 domain-containing protein n=1 Tax=Corynebacterium caspium TaxID=234828 RepID=UPI00036D2CAE|nr:DUF3107 domain-containing protein [Corynebacterium caspium]WKD59694.1 hypothetical protein CCASP_06575 [Corynebacterium caspium DSM 44850]